MTSAKNTKNAKNEATLKEPVEATAMLTADHEKVDALFTEFSKARSPEKKKGIVAQICEELTVHAELEEEIFYPAFKKALSDTELEPEARVEHQTLKDLIAQLEDAEPDGEMYDARVNVLCEYVKHHVEEEQNEMFPKAKASRKLDLFAIGAQMTERKKELLMAYE